MKLLLTNLEFTPSPFALHRRSQYHQTPVVRCAIYTRKSTEEGLNQEFNSLDAQREAGEAYVKSQQDGDGLRQIDHRRASALLVVIIPGESVQ